MHFKCILCAILCIGCIKKWLLSSNFSGTFSVFLLNNTTCYHSMQLNQQRISKLWLKGYFSELKLRFSFIYIEIKREQSAFLQSTLICFERLKESYPIKHYIYAIHKSFVYGTISFNFLFHLYKLK